jgi:RNA-splicing ligase RtcB
MIATETAFDAGDLPSTLDPLLSMIGKRIPAGVGKGRDLGYRDGHREVSVDERGRVWTVLHSGSRGIGNQLATYHIGKAKGVMREYLSTLGDPDLAYFTVGTPEFDAYIQDMLWAQRYAYESRAKMNSELLKSLAGRRLSRGQAKRELDKAGLKDQMKGKTWLAASATSLIDEDPRAYKDIRQVMEDQSDLTSVVHRLTQVLNYKGTG